MNSFYKNLKNPLQIGKQDQGFTLLELLTVFLLLGTIVGIALPRYLGQVDKARTAEAKFILGAMNRSQQTYRFEEGTFAQSIEDLHISLAVGSYDSNNQMYISRYFTYRIINTAEEPLNNQEVHHLAEPKTEYIGDARQVTSAVFLNDSITQQVICEATDNNITPYITLQPSKEVTCGLGKFVR